MNKQDIQAVLTRELNLSLHGFGFCGSPDQSIKEQLADFKRDRLSLLMSSAICTKVCDWLSHNIRPIKTISRLAGSYSLKHLAERAIGQYVANGQLICSAIHLGYPYRIGTISSNARFGMSARDLDRVREIDHARE